LGGSGGTGAGPGRTRLGGSGGARAGPGRARLGGSGGAGAGPGRARLGSSGGARAGPDRARLGGSGGARDKCRGGSPYLQLRSCCGGVGGGLWQATPAASTLGGGCDSASSGAVASSAFDRGGNLLRRGGLPAGVVCSGERASAPLRLAHPPGGAHEGGSLPRCGSSVETQVGPRGLPSQP